MLIISRKQDEPLWIAHPASGRVFRVSVTKVNWSHFLVTILVDGEPSSGVIWPDQFVKLFAPVLGGEQCCRVGARQNKRYREMVEILIDGPREEFVVHRSQPKEVPCASAPA